MDKRFLLALALTAIVVIATPWLFGTQSSNNRKGTRDTTLAADSSGTAARTTSIDSSRVATQPVAPAVSAAPSLSPSLSAAEAPTPDTTVVSSRLADYRFTNLGAVPLSIDLKAFKALD